MDLKTLQDYQDAVKKFNQLSFKNKIRTLMNHKNTLILGNDNNWWIVKVKDEEVQEQLEDLGQTFDIENEWVGNETYDLIALLGLDITDA